MGSNPEYKNKIDTQTGKIWEYIKNTPFATQKDQVFSVMGKEWDKIMALPSDKQAEAIGSFAGNVIAVLATIRGGIAIAEKITHMSSKTAQAARITERLTKR